MSSLAKDYVKSLDDFLIALLRFLLSIRKELFKQEKSFPDEINLKSQKESIPKELLFVTKSFIDRSNYYKVNFSLESLTVAQIIISNATKKTKIKKDKKLARQHRKCQKTSLIIYNSLKMYSTCCSINRIDHFVRIQDYDIISKLTQNIYDDL